MDVRGFHLRGYAGQLRAGTTVDHPQAMPGVVSPAASQVVVLAT